MIEGNDEKMKDFDLKKNISPIEKEVSDTNLIQKQNETKTIDTTCMGNIPEVKKDLTLTEKNKLYNSFLGKIYKKHEIKVGTKNLSTVSLDEAEFAKLECIFESIGQEATKSQVETMIKTYIKNKKYQKAKELSVAFNMKDFTIKHYAALAKDSLKIYGRDQATDFPYKLAQEYRLQIESLDASKEIMDSIDKQIEYVRPVGSFRGAYKMCKDNIEEKLQDVTEFEYGTFDLLASGALLGKSGCDIVNEKVCILKFNSWVKTRNRKRVFRCEVTYDKKTEQGKVTKLTF